jgi:hypothetical protein
VRLDLIWADPQLLAETSVQNTLAADRRKRLVAQQERFATMLWDAKTADRAAKETEAKAERELRRATLTGQRVKLLEQLSAATGSLSERFSTIWIDFNSKTESAKDFFGKHFYLEGLDPDGAAASDAWVSAYREIAVGSLHLLISEYIETGAVQWLTHGASSQARMKDVKTAHAAVLERVNTALGGLDQTVYGALSETFVTFSKNVGEFIESVSHSDGDVRPHDLATGHTTLACTCTRCKACTTPRKLLFRKAFETMMAADWAALLGVDATKLTVIRRSCVVSSDFINITNDRFGIDSSSWMSGLPKWAGDARLTVAVVSESLPNCSARRFGATARLFRHRVLVAKPSPATAVDPISPPDALRTLGRLFSPIGTASLLKVDPSGSVAAFRLFPKVTRIDLADTDVPARQWCISCSDRVDGSDLTTMGEEVVVLSFDRYYV